MKRRKKIALSDKEDIGFFSSGEQKAPHEEVLFYWFYPDSKIIPKLMVHRHVLAFRKNKLYRQVVNLEFL